MFRSSPQIASSRLRFRVESEISLFELSVRRAASEVLDSLNSGPSSFQALYFALTMTEVIVKRRVWIHIKECREKVVSVDASLSKEVL